VGEANNIDKKMATACKIAGVKIAERYDQMHVEENAIVFNTFHLCNRQPTTRFVK